MKLKKLLILGKVACRTSELGARGLEPPTTVPMNSALCRTPARGAWIKHYSILSLLQQEQRFSVTEKRCFCWPGIGKKRTKHRQVNRKLAVRIVKSKEKCYNNGGKK